MEIFFLQMEAHLKDVLPKVICSYWKPAKGGDRGLDDRKKTKGKEMIGYAKWVSERSVVCGIKEKSGKQERLENMEAKNLPNGRTLTMTYWKMSITTHHGIQLFQALKQF